MEYAVKIINLILNYYYYLSIDKLEQKLQQRKVKSGHSSTTLVRNGAKNELWLHNLNSYIYLYTDIRIFQHFSVFVLRALSKKIPFLVSPAFSLLYMLY